MKAKGKVVPVEKRHLSARGAKSYLECSDEYLKNLNSIDLFISQHLVVKQRTR